MSPGKRKDRTSDRYDDNWGGKRQPRAGRNLGRPPVPKSEKRQTVCVSLPPWLVRWLEARRDRTEESTSTAVERAVSGFYGLEGPEGEAE